jgi:hypothetical protein
VACAALGDRQVINLLSAAGTLVGLGDWRPQRKGGPYGTFRLCGPDDQELKAIVAAEGHDAQQAAFDTPEMWDEETSELIEWFMKEVADREQDLPSMSDVAANTGVGTRAAGNGAKARAR